MAISAIILAGGMGSRMQSTLAKQFLPLGNKLVIEYCLEVFFTLPEIKEVIVVCDTAYRHLLSSYPIKFASPGPRRQDSLYQGLQQATSPWICIHDAARPFITQKILKDLFEAGKETGAATLALPIVSTVKQSHEMLVEKTLDRSVLWEAQTPQFLSHALLVQGFAYTQQHNLTVTDDVMFAELLGHPTKLVKGISKNIKLTTPEDFALAQAWCSL